MSAVVFVSAEHIPEARETRDLLPFILECLKRYTCGTQRYTPPQGSREGVGWWAGGKPLGVLGLAPELPGPICDPTRCRGVPGLISVPLADLVAPRHTFWVNGIPTLPFAT